MKIKCSLYSARRRRQRIRETLKSKYNTTQNCARKANICLTQICARAQWENGTMRCAHLFGLIALARIHSYTLFISILEAHLPLVICLVINIRFISDKNIFLGSCFFFVYSNPQYCKPAVQHSSFFFIFFWVFFFITFHERKLHCGSHCSFITVKLATVYIYLYVCIYRQCI